VGCRCNICGDMHIVYDPTRVECGSIA
jgi:hypothetical protein